LNLYGKKACQKRFFWLGQGILTQARKNQTSGLLASAFRFAGISSQYAVQEIKKAVFVPKKGNFWMIHAATIFFPILRLSSSMVFF
jgi:hypothetical protein